MNCKLCANQIDETNAAKTIFGQDKVLCCTCEQLAQEIMAKAVGRAIAEKLAEWDNLLTQYFGEVRHD